MRRLSISRQTRCALLIFLCFLWTSTCYLCWLYRLMDVLSGQWVEASAEVGGYLLQALGIFLFASLVRHRRAANAFFALITGADLACAALAVLLPGRVVILTFGGCMNLLHGVLAGFYLHRLSQWVDWNRRGLTFGLGYGLASLATWLLSLISSGLRSTGMLPVCAVIAALSVWLYWPVQESMPVKAHSEPFGLSLLVLAGVSVILLSLVKGLGFSFPSADLRKGIDLELSRVFYAVGLLAAGLVSDRERKYGAIICVASLGVPFLLIGLSERLGPSLVFWIIGYLLSGFFTVFRVLLFSDLAQKDEKMGWLSGFGLLFGRIGDALGALGCILLFAQPVMQIVLAAALFAATIVCFLLLYQRAYLPARLPVPSERERFDRFAAANDLSGREREVLQLILDGRSTPEIAEALFVTESTVKFHIHNLLKKTGCSNRIALIAYYRDEY